MNDCGLEPFVDATRTTFKTMLGIHIEPGQLQEGSEVVGGYDVSGVVGLSRLGTADRPNCGSLVLSFPSAVARKVVGTILGVGELPELDQDVADGIGELVNVIAGQAKRGMAEFGILDCRTTLPNVILGSRHRVFYQRNVERCAVLFQTEFGPFLLQRVLLFPMQCAPGGTGAGSTRGGE